MDDDIRIHDESAADYDQQARECGYYGHELVFGICYEFIDAGDTLLDIGIGTGLSSELFAKAGAEIQGLDGSEAMLNVCRKKNLATELKLFNLKELPLPYPDESFNHAICVGVFHFIPEIEPIVSEVSRIMKKDGIFAFTAAVPASEGENDDDTCEIDTPWGRTIFAHSERFVIRLGRAYGFEEMKQQKFLIPTVSESDDLLVRVFVLRKADKI